MNLLRFRSAPIRRTPGVPCVPVSTTESPQSVSVLAEAINTLIEAGYKLGCDGELLPPKWAYEAFKGADA